MCNFLVCFYQVALLACLSWNRTALGTEQFCFIMTNDMQAPPQGSPHQQWKFSFTKAIQHLQDYCCEHSVNKAVISHSSHHHEACMYTLHVLALQPNIFFQVAVEIFPFKIPTICKMILSDRTGKISWPKVWGICKEKAPKKYRYSDKF